MTTFIEHEARPQDIGNRKPICGVGINDAWYKTSPAHSRGVGKCPYYSVWVSMVQRCYSNKVQKVHPTYVGCTVHVPWLKFSVFRSWMERQDWFGKQLDKDILVPGNKLYSPTTCVFVSKEVNNLLLDNKRSRGQYPIGVTYIKRFSTYRASMSVKGRTVELGTYHDVLKAEYAYLEAKALYIREVANTQGDKVRKALLLIAYNMLTRVK